MQIVLPSKFAFGKDLLHRRDLGHHFRETGRRGGQQCSPCCAPNGIIGSPISYVIETFESESGNQAVSFALTAQIGLTVAPEHRIEQTHISIHFLGQCLIRCSSENQRTTKAFLFAQKLEEIGTIRQQMDVRHGSRGQPLLKICTALDPPKR